MVNKQEETKEEKKKWMVGQIPTATKDVIVNTETEEAFTVEQALVLILNKLDETL